MIEAMLKRNAGIALAAFLLANRADAASSNGAFAKYVVRKHHLAVDQRIQLQLASPNHRNRVTEEDQ